MADIYQQLMDVDVQKSAGIQALLPNEERDENLGYIVVTESEQGSGGARRLFTDMKIPESKMKSYNLARVLFDNYNIQGNERDVITAAESTERDTLIDFVMTTEPMKMARDYVEQKTNVKREDDAWRKEIFDAWFHEFRSGGDPTRSGFEHVMLGEWNTRRNIVGGFHWWYYYFMNREDIDYGGAKYGSRDAISGISVPELVTMTFEWEVEDDVTINKSTGGFFVGPSVECMMAMGMVRRASTNSDSDFTTIYGMDINLRMFKSDDGVNAINTFFPILLRVVSGLAPTTGTNEIRNGNNNTTNTTNTISPAPSSGSTGVRLISIVSNPEGSIDTGREKVTLINMFGEEAESLNGWRVQGPNRSDLIVGDVTLKKGEAITLVIRKSDGLQLSNKGGEIKLLRPDSTVAQTVRYGSSVAKVQGGVLLWNGEGDFVLYSQ